MAQTLQSIGSMSGPQMQSEISASSQSITQPSQISQLAAMLKRTPMQFKDITSEQIRKLQKMSGVETPTEGSITLPKQNKTWIYILIAILVCYLVCLCSSIISSLIAKMQK